MIPNPKTKTTRKARIARAYSPWFLAGSRFLSLWTGLLYNRWVSDVGSCFKLARTDVWRDLDLRSRAVEAEMTGKLLKAGHPIYEVPIKYNGRTRERARKRKGLDGVTALWVLLRIRLFSR